MIVKINQEAKDNLHRIIESSEEEGLPSEILMARMREGAAKKIGRSTGECLK